MMANPFTDPDFCTNLSGYYPVHDYIPGLQTNIGIILLVAGLLNVFMSLVTVFWIRRQRYLAQEETDNDEAVNSVIFPVFVRLLWLSVTVNIISGITVILVPMHRGGENTAGASALFGFVWAMQHGVLEGVAFLLMQKGCGQHAAKRARMWSFWWISFVFVLMFCSFYYGGLVTAILAPMRDAILVLFYFVMVFAPQQRLFRRPAALFYSKCWLTYRGFFLLLYLLMVATNTEYLGNCGYILLSLFLFAIMQPLIMYITLLRDSLWWQGVEINPRSNRTDAANDIRGPLLGSEYSLQSAQALAGTVDDMRVRGNVTMLNFACIKLNSNKTLGAGSFSKVYKGTYRGKDCAIKLIYTVDITAETIKKVAAEASILSSIRHKNIVNILGVSVLPPSVCLILELCSFGSLSDIIRGYGFDWNSSHRAPLKLAYADVLYLALGCARGLAAVHSYDNTLCHRDVKSFNFLVDHQFNVKIADLELGFMTAQGGGLSAYEVNIRDPYAQDDAGQALLSENAAAENDPNLAQRRRSDPDCVDVNELLANWLAPEVILERKFQQASDVYALGTVLWEILSGELPFDGEHPIGIRRKIVSGYVHTIPPQYVNTALGQLIHNCWAFDPKQRPTSREIATTLETALHDQCYKVIKSTETIPDTTVLRNFYDQHYRKSVYGDSTLHKYLFADLRGPSFFQYINPLNWARYLYNIYTEPRYRGLSVDDSSEGSIDSSLSASGPGTSDARDSLHRRLFEQADEENDSTGGLSRSSYVMSEDRSPGGQPMFAQLPRAALDVIGAIKEEQYWEALERSGVAWAVTTIDAPYIVMHATTAWYKLFNIPHSQGSYHHMYSIMSLIGRDSTMDGVNGTPGANANAGALNSNYTASNAYVKEWKEVPVGSKNKSTHQSATNAMLTEMHEGYRTRNYKEVHGVLCFSLASRKGDVTPRASRGSFSVGTTSTATAVPAGHNLMCTLHAYPIYATPSEEAPHAPGEGAPVGAGASAAATGGSLLTPIKGPSMIFRVATDNGNGGTSTPTGRRSSGLVSNSPARDTFSSALSMSLASVNTGAGSKAGTAAVSAAAAQAETPALRRSATQMPNEAPSSVLRRTNTQVSHTSFASSIRTSFKPDVPKPVYYAIQFHELSESHPQIVGEDGIIPPGPPPSPRSYSGSQSGSGQSPESTGGILSSLLPSIGRFWSSDKSKGRASESGKSFPPGSSTLIRPGSFGGSSSILSDDERSRGSRSSVGSGSRGSRDSRHSVS